MIYYLFPPLGPILPGFPNLLGTVDDALKWKFVLGSLIIRYRFSSLILVELLNITLEMLLWFFDHYNQVDVP